MPPPVPPPLLPAVRRSPLLPTAVEAALLAVYPSTLLLGSLFSLLDPAARATDYDLVTQAHAHPPSYFARKRNLFNVLFVKIGWFWITLAYVIFLFPSAVLTPRRLRGLVRYALLTLYWLAVTRWLFGPPLIDRLFTLSGGLCDRDGIASSATCKAVGGRWAGGHDVSGHVFLLALGSTFLWMEAMPFALRRSGVRDERLVASGAVVRRAEVERQPGAGEVEPAGLGLKAVAGIAGLSWWMLLMTAAYFHTWLEKLTGLLVAFAGIFAVYYLPRVVPALREVLGMPGL
ncbi:MAG: hypothetical protein M1832_003203 [Thelocarpon impressellum]|nr:MAG: hypothetical protein M1832_003203 [Thelocarpon impressellum]